MTDKEALGEFYDFFWGGQEGFVYLPTKARNGDWKKVFYAWPKSRDSVINHTLVSSAEGKDIYFSPVIYNKPIIEGKDHIKGSNVLWADFDGSAPTWEPLGTGENASKAPEPPPDLPAPTLRIQSSTEDHQHVYWKLDTFNNDVAYIEEKNRSIAYTSKADLGGWDIQQVLRPPYTTNYKHDVPVTIAEESTRTYPGDAFSSLKAAKQLVTEGLELGKEVPVADIYAKYDWPKEMYDLFIQDTPTGDRSSALMRVGHFGAEQGMTDIEIFSLLVHADDRWGKFKGRTDRVKRLSDIVNRSRQKHPVALTNDTFAGLLGTKNVEVDKQYVYGFKDFLNADFRLEWVVKNLMSTMGMGLVTSAPGIGKTQLCIQFGCHIALGKKFMSYEPTGPKKVAYLSLEMGGPATKSFVEEMAKGYEAEEINLLQENFIIVPLGEAIPLDRAEGKKFLENLIEDNAIDVVVIDSLGQMVAGELGDDTIIRAFFNYLNHVKEKFNCSFMIIHHNRKGTADNKKAKHLSDVFGSQYITSSVDFVLSLWKEDDFGDEIEVSEIKNRLAAQQRPFTIKRIEHLNFQRGSGSPLSDDAVILKGKEDKPNDRGANFEL